jgi:hypothetical protein
MCAYSFIATGMQWLPTKHAMSTSNTDGMYEDEPVKRSKVSNAQVEGHGAQSASTTAFTLGACRPAGQSHCASKLGSRRMRARHAAHSGIKHIGPHSDALNAARDQGRDCSDPTAEPTGLLWQQKGNRSCEATSGADSSTPLAGHLHVSAAGLVSESNSSKGAKTQGMALGSDHSVQPPAWWCTAAAAAASPPRAADEVQQQLKTEAAATALGVTLSHRLVFADSLAEPGRAASAAHGDNAAAAAAVRAAAERSTAAGAASAAQQLYTFIPPLLQQDGPGITSSLRGSPATPPSTPASEMSQAGSSLSDASMLARCGSGSNTLPLSGLLSSPVAGVLNSGAAAQLLRSRSGSRAPPSTPTGAPLLPALTPTNTPADSVSGASTPARLASDASTASSWRINSGLGRTDEYGPQSFTGRAASATAAMTATAAAAAAAAATLAMGFSGRTSSCETPAATPHTPAAPDGNGNLHALQLSGSFKDRLAALAEEEAQLCECSTERDSVRPSTAAVPAADGHQLLLGQPLMSEPAGTVGTAASDTDSQELAAAAAAAAPEAAALPTPATLRLAGRRSHLTEIPEDSAVTPLADSAGGHDTSSDDEASSSQAADIASGIAAQPAHNGHGPSPPCERAGSSGSSQGRARSASPARGHGARTPPVSTPHGHLGGMCLLLQDGGPGSFCSTAGSETGSMASTGSMTAALRTRLEAVPLDEMALRIIRSSSGGSLASAGAGAAATGSLRDGLLATSASASVSAEQRYGPPSASSRVHEEESVSLHGTPASSPPPSPIKGIVPGAIVVCVSRPVGGSDGSQAAHHQLPTGAGVRREALPTESPSADAALLSLQPQHTPMKQDDSRSRMQSMPGFIRRFWGCGCLGSAGA